MGRGFLQIGRVTPGHSFQADRYSFGERRRREANSIFTKQARWWAAASFMERASRVLWLSVCASVGLTFGFVAIVLVSGLFH